MVSAFRSTTSTDGASRCSCGPTAEVLCVQVWEGDGVVASFRKLVGATNPLSAEPGTIRGDFGRVTGRNIVHASDSPDNGVREAGAPRRVSMRWPSSLLLGL